MGGGGRLGGEGIIWFHLHLFTWTPWANGNHFHLKTGKRGEKARQPELNCDGTQCVKVCASKILLQRDFALNSRVYNVNGREDDSAYCKCTDIALLLFALFFLKGRCALTWIY